MPGSSTTRSPTRKLLRLGTLMPVAPAAAGTLSVVVTKRSAPVSKLYAITSRLYQCSSALLPAAE